MGQSQDSERKDEFLNKCLCVISTERIFKTISLDKITKQGKKKMYMEPWDITAFQRQTQEEKKQKQH